MKFNKILLFLIDWVWHLHLVPKVVHAILPIRFPACCEGSIIQPQWPTAKPTATPPKFLTTLPREKMATTWKTVRSGFWLSVHSCKLTVAIKNLPFWWYLPGKMEIFHGFVSLAEGRGKHSLVNFGFFPTENSRFGHLAVERTARQPPRLPTTRRRPRSSATHKPQPL